MSNDVSRASSSLPQGVTWIVALIKENVDLISQWRSPTKESGTSTRSKRFTVSIELRAIRDSRIFGLLPFICN